MVLPQRCRRIAESLASAAEPYAFPVLCDERREMARAYGVWHPMGWASLNTARPAAFLIGADARVRYAFVGTAQFERAPLDAMLRAAPP